MILDPVWVYVSDFALIHREPATEQTDTVTNVWLISNTL